MHEDYPGRIQYSSNTVLFSECMKTILEDANIVPDSAFTASSVLNGTSRNEEYLVHHARIDSLETGSTANGDYVAGSWCPDTNDTNQYIQVGEVKAPPLPDKLASYE